MIPGWLHALLVPPLNLLLVAGLGLLLSIRRRRLGTAIAGGSLFLLYLFSTSLVSAPLLRSLEVAPLPEGPIPGPAPGAIVVLGGDAERRAPEYGGTGIGALTLERLRYAAVLQRRTGLPVLTTGGPFGRGIEEGGAGGRGPALAELMRRALEQDFGVEVRWVEGRSGTTYENARYSAGILKTEGIERVLLVTHAWHMPRSLASFRKAGLDPVAAPTGYRMPLGFELGDFLPGTKGLRESSLALHEWMGRIAYRVLHGAG